MVKLKVLIKVLLAVISFLSSILGIYDFTSGKVDDYKEPRNKIIDFLHTINKGYERDVETTIKEKETDLEITIDITKGILRAEIFNFELGDYRLTESPHLQKILNNLNIAIKGLLTDYTEDYDIIIDISGYADGYDVLEDSKYMGDLGLIHDFEYYSTDRGKVAIKNMSRGDKLHNEDIAFLRAYDLLQFIYLQKLISSSAEFNVYSNTTDFKGGRWRKILLMITINDILKNQYQRLTPPTKLWLWLST